VKRGKEDGVSGGERCGLKGQNADFLQLPCKEARAEGKERRELGERQVKGV